MKLLVRWGILALSVWIATAIVPGIKVHHGVWNYLWVALLFGLINAFLGRFLKLLTFPAILLTFGLFSFVINAAMLELTARWSTAIDIKNFWSALLASLIITVVSAALKGTVVKGRV
jgi:putative membrane protein